MKFLKQIISSNHNQAGDVADAQINKGQYISLKEAAKITGYSSDYIGQLIRQGKLHGEKVYCSVAWMTTEADVRNYLEGKVANLEGRDTISYQKHGLLQKRMRFFSNIKIASFGLRMIAILLVICIFAIVSLLSIAIDRKINARNQPMQYVTDVEIQPIVPIGL